MDTNSLQYFSSLKKCKNRGCPQIWNVKWSDKERSEAEQRRSRRSGIFFQARCALPGRGRGRRCCWESLRIWIRGARLAGARHFILAPVWVGRHTTASATRRPTATLIAAGKCGVCRLSRGEKRWACFQADFSCINRRGATISPHCSLLGRPTVVQVIEIFLTGSKVIEHNKYVILRGEYCRIWLVEAREKDVLNVWHKCLIQW